jgi:hypothetical protein
MRALFAGLVVILSAVAVPVVASAATPAAAAPATAAVFTISPDPVPVGHTFTVSGPTCGQPTVSLTLAFGGDQGPTNVAVPVAGDGSWSYSGGPLLAGGQWGIDAMCGGMDLGSGQAVSAAFVITGGEGNIESSYALGSPVHITGFGCQTATAVVSLWHGGKVVEGPKAEPADDLGVWSLTFTPSTRDVTLGLGPSMPYGIAASCGSTPYPAHVVGLQYFPGTSVRPNQVLLAGQPGTEVTALGLGCVGSDAKGGPTGARISADYTYRFELASGRSTAYVRLVHRVLVPTPDSGWWTTVPQSFAAPPANAVAVRVRAEASCVPTSGSPYFAYPGRTVVIHFAVATR